MKCTNVFIVLKYIRFNLRRSVMIDYVDNKGLNGIPNGDMWIYRLKLNTKLKDEESVSGKFMYDSFAGL